MKKLLLLAVATLAMAACSEAATSPSSARLRPSEKASLDFTCKSGYIVAYDENGNPYCKLDDTFQGGSASRPKP